MKKYDVVVIGAGVAGSAAAYALKRGGKNVALIEDDLWGGTCPNRGCNPKKVLTAGVEVVERNNQLVGKGFAPITSIDWPELMAFKRTFTDHFPASYRKKAESAGIDTFAGTACFTDGNRIDVAGQDIEADAFIIATGQRPDVLDIEGKELLKTSDDFFEMEELPNAITFIGAGYVAFELAAIAHAAGSEVTVIHHNDRPLKSFDVELVTKLVEVMESRGIRMVFDVDIRSLRKDSEAFELAAEGYSGKADCVVCATGRIPYLEHLGLERAGITYGKRGISVNEYLQTSNETVYACGDVLMKREPKLTPTAWHEGGYVAQHILGNRSEGISYPPIASIVFGSPKLANAGISSEEARKDPDRYAVKDMDVTNWFTYRRINEPAAWVKMVFEGDRLVGATVLGSQADELINFLAIVIDRGIAHDDIDRMLFGSPTTAGDLSNLV